MDYNRTTTPTSTNSTLAIDDQAEHLLKIISKYLWVVTAPLLLFVGTLGNILSLIILHTKAFRGTGTSFILCALAFTDTAMLYSELLLDFVSFASDHSLYVRDLGEAACKVHTFIAYSLSLMSSWTVVQVAISRALMVCYPYKAKRLCSRRNMVCGWISLVALIVCLQIHCFWTVNLRPTSKASDNRNEAMGKKADMMTCRELSPVPWKTLIAWKHFIFISVLPALIIVITNAIIIRRLSTTKINKESGSSPSRRNEPNQRWNSVSRMLVTVSVVFLVTTLPVTVFEVTVSPWDFSKQLNTNYRPKYQLICTCVLLLYYTNSAINFFLYVLSGRSFRKALKQVLLDARPNQCIVPRVD